MCAPRQSSPSSNNWSFNRHVQKGLIQSISETNSPDKVLLTYFAQVDKLAPKQKAVFPKAARKAESFQGLWFHWCFLLPAMSIFQGALSGFQLCNNVQPTSVSSKKLFQPKTSGLRQYFKHSLLKYHSSLKKLQTFQKNVRSVGHEFFLVCFVAYPTQWVLVSARPCCNGREKNVAE